MGQRAAAAAPAAPRSRRPAAAAPARTLTLPRPLPPPNPPPSDRPVQFTANCIAAKTAALGGPARCSGLSEAEGGRREAGG